MRAVLCFGISGICYASTLPLDSSSVFHHLWADSVIVVVFSFERMERLSQKLLTFAPMRSYWMLLFLLIPLSGLGYSLWRTWTILPLAPIYKWMVLGVMLLCFVCFFLNFAWGLDDKPMPVAVGMYEVGNSTIFILLYLVMIYLLLDLGRLVHLVPPSFVTGSVRGSLAVVGLLAVLFTYGYFHYQDKVRQEITLATSKPLPRPLKMVMLSDLHLGYHNRVGEFRRWVELINDEHPDLVLIGGDIIDGSIRALNEQGMAAEFRKLNAPVYACLGNHEYYSGNRKAQQFYREAGIHLLIDSVITVDGINIVGRDDRTNSRRALLQTLAGKMDKSKYTILLDHQPYHLEEAEKAGIDFQLSGHTHYGQVWPISWIEDAIYEDAYGPLTKGRTQYFVTSGIGIWGGKFRIGTRSEYLVATLANND